MALPLGMGAGAIDAALNNLVFGLLAQAAGAWLFPHFLLALALLMYLPTLLLVRRLRARGRYE